MARTSKTFEPVTIGHILSHGCRELLVYCTSPWCSHSATLNGDWLIGAEVRPDWTPMTGTGGMGGAHTRS